MFFLNNRSNLEKKPHELSYRSIQVSKRFAIKSIEIKFSYASNIFITKYYFNNLIALYSNTLEKILLPNLIREELLYN